MALLVFTFLGIFLYMVLEGEAHPFAAGWDRTTLLTAHGLFTFVSILCLFRLYRGSTSVKHLMGLAAAIAIFMFAILLTLNFLNELSTVWMALDAFGLLVSGFLVWACFFSRSVSGFLNHQQDAR